MQVRKSLIALAAAALLAPTAAHAQYSGKFQWVGVGNSFGWSYKGTQYPNGVGIYGGAAYQARFYINTPYKWLPPHSTVSNTFGPVVDIYCVDFTHHAQSAYNAYFTKIGISPMTKTRSSNVTDYLKAAWLIQKMDATPLTGNTNAQTTAYHQTRADIHAAIWYMMSGEPKYVLHGNTWDNTGFTSWINAANANWNDGSVNESEWTVVTDACVYASGHAGAGFGPASADNCSQEFLTRNVTPEPATMILLGTGLLATLMMTGIVRRQNA